MGKVIKEAMPLRGRVKNMTDEKRFELEAQFTEMQQSDQWSVDLGIIALKTALLINAGALVALLAFASNLSSLFENRDGSLWNLLAAFRPFVYGVVAAALAAGVAYLYQSIAAATAEHEFRELLAGQGLFKSRGWLDLSGGVTAIIMIILVLFAYAAFAWGAVGVISGLQAAFGPDLQIVQAPAA